MIATEFFEGQGLGNQLFCYAVTRSIAKKKSYKFGILSPEKFKGQHFLDLDLGDSVTENCLNYRYYENLVRNSQGKDISPIDYDMCNVSDSTLITGTMQSVKYFEGIEEDVKSWIIIREPYPPISENTCIIHFRGGDFVWAGNTLLQTDYYKNAIKFMKQKNPNMYFCIVTDDPVLARKTIPEAQLTGSCLTKYTDPYQASHHIGKDISIDFRVMASAKNLIISNSSFGWWATYINKNNPYVIAPKYWAAYNYDQGFWSTAEIKVDEWHYLDKKGILS